MKRMKSVRQNLEAKARQRPCLSPWRRTLLQLSSQLRRPVLQVCPRALGHSDPQGVQPGARVRWVHHGTVEALPGVSFDFWVFI